MELIQYLVVWVNLDPTIGSEIKKTRPCIIISPDEMNMHLNTIVIAPVTSSSKNYPTRIEFKTATIKGWIVVDQIRTIDKSRVMKAEDKLDNTFIEKLKSIIRETFVD